MIGKATEKLITAEIGLLESPSRTPFQEDHRRRLIRAIRAATDEYPNGFLAYQAMKENSVATASFALDTPERTLYRNRKIFLQEVARGMGWE